MKILFPLINIFSIILLYITLSKKISNKLFKITRDIFKIQTILSPITILYSITFAYILKINIKEMGFQIGDLKTGLTFIAIFGIPIFILSYIFAKKAKKEEIENFSYLKIRSKWQIIYVFFFVGLTEETFFRGLIQTYLNKSINLFISITLTSVIFSLFHILNVKTKNETFRVFLQLFPIRFVISLILGYTFQLSKSLIYPAIIHNLMDGITLLTIQKIIYNKRSRSNTL
ncbi:CAAX protease [Thermosipho sp. 1063]|uniref:CPBP family intramembrane glutamic endopeptidase n=1 Tax=Thermosipho sp. 1063 TaxID=1462747 RepID=UPI0009505ED6|nr:type II CAAX endopeptidase family protein [Thermosipho sp. 1063]APT72000.1 CAAX protease [Thermosipho sp. 1063]